MFSKTRILLITSAATLLLTAGVSRAETPPAPPPGAPTVVPVPAKDYKAGTAGTYNMDTTHTSVIVRVPHMGFSYNVVRFGDVSGVLQWDPAKPESSVLNVTVKVASVETPVTGHDGKPWGDTIAGDFLKGGQFPDATFQSTAFHPTSENTGTVEGVLTIKGIAKPVTFNVTLNGAGKNIFGKFVMGVSATASINPQDYGMPAMISNPTDLVIDSEFDRQ